MRAIFGLVLVAGLGLAGFAVYMVKDHLNAQQQAIANAKAQAAQAVATVEVYAVNRNVAYGEPITADDVVMIKYAKAHLPEGTFATAEDLFPEGSDVARVAISPLALNEPVLAHKVTAPGENAGITTRLKDGMRAFTINVDETTGVSGFVRPGDRVDVMWSGTIQTQEGSASSRLISRRIRTNLEVIAVDQSVDATRTDAEVASTVTVQVLPKDALALDLAQKAGSLSLSLVGNNESVDTTSDEIIEIDQYSLLGLTEPASPAPQVAPPPMEQVCQRRVRRGAEVIMEVIPCTN